MGAPLKRHVLDCGCVVMNSRVITRCPEASRLQAAADKPVTYMDLQIDGVRATLAQAGIDLINHYKRESSDAN